MHPSAPSTFARGVQTDEQIARSVREQAFGILREGRLDVRRRDDQLVEAVVRGHRGHHRVRHTAGGGWSCTCPDVALVSVCGHIMAAEMVTHVTGAPGVDGRPKAVLR